MSNCGCVNTTGEPLKGQHTEVWVLTDRKTGKAYILCCVDLTTLITLLKKSKRPGELPKLMRLKSGMKRFEQTLSATCHGIGEALEAAEQVRHRLQKAGTDVECAHTSP